MSILSKLGVKNDLDFLNIDNLYAIRDIMLGTIDDLLIGDNDIDLNKALISEQDRSLLDSWINGKHKLYDQLEAGKVSSGLRDRFYRDKKRFKALIQTHSGKDWNAILKNMVCVEFDQCIYGKHLQNTNSALFADGGGVETKSTYTKHNFVLNIEGKYVFTENVVKLATDNQHNNIKLINSDGAVTISDKKDTINKETRVCLGCGKDISHQRRGSKYCGSAWVGKKESKKCRNLVSNKKQRSKPVNTQVTLSDKQKLQLVLKERMNKMRDRWNNTPTAVMRE